MSFDPQLGLHLKQLRLSGMLETLDVRLNQAMAPMRATFSEQMSYLDFLQRLLAQPLDRAARPGRATFEDEIARRTHRQLSLRVRRANFQTDKTIDGPSNGPLALRLLV